MNYSELIEKRAHGTFDFPIEYFQITPYHRSYIMEPHWHAEMEIIRVRSGTFSLHLNKQHYLLKPFDIAIVNPGTLHRGEPQNCSYDCAVFHLDMLCPSGSVIHQYVRPLVRNSLKAQEYIAHGSNTEIEETIERLFTCLAQKEERYELRVFAELYTFLSALYRNHILKNPEKRALPDRRLVQMTKLLEWISTHYTEKITLARLSKESGLNEKYLCRVFKEYTSYTPIEYINRFRIEKAIDTIVSGNDSITEAAFANGFNDSAYFSKLFHRIKGMQPSAYVRQLRDAEALISDS